MPTSHQAMIFSGKFVRTHLYNTRYKIAADFNLYLKTNRERVIFITSKQPLTLIEAVGIASENPTQSYAEYLIAASENLHGVLKWLTLARIGFKAIFIISLKKTLPRNWVSALRRYL